MAISLLQDRLARLVLTDPAEDHFEDLQMLPPMFLGNDAGISHCMTGTDFQRRVLQHEVRPSLGPSFVHACMPCTSSLKASICSATRHAIDDTHAVGGLTTPSAILNKDQQHACGAC